MRPENSSLFFFVPAFFFCFTVSVQLVMSICIKSVAIYNIVIRLYLLHPASVPFRSTEITNPVSQSFVIR
jgi:hypothetical protein